MRSNKSNITTYLSFCDLSNKYLVTNIFNLPKIKNLSIELSFSDLIVINENNFVQEKEAILKFKAFLLFYFYFQKKPFIKLQKVISKNIKEEKQSRLSFQVNYTNFSNINYVFRDLFFEKRFMLQKLFYKENNFTLYFQFLVLAKSFESLEKLSKDLFKDFSIKDLNFKINFKVTKPVNVSNLGLFLQNLPFFWING